MENLIRLPKICDESGAALLLALLVLLLLSLLGLFVSFSATAGVQISDNYEAETQAVNAALAGLNHARVLLRGLDLDDQLKGPDGVFDPGISYLAEAKTYRFRLPLPLQIAGTLDLVDPSVAVAGIPDDGLPNTGMYAGIAGAALIPKTGILLESPNPYGAGTLAAARYFVKITDNNGDASETAGDPANSPFTDGDGILIVRSMGIARTMVERLGSVLQRNSISVFESRLKRLSTWRVGSALITIGSHVTADFDGSIEIAGGSFPGIATIDSDPADLFFPDQIIRSAATGYGSITGCGIASPSVSDVTEQISSNRDRARLLNPGYLWEFVYKQAPRMADSFFSGNQNWVGTSTPYLGMFDPSNSMHAPGQDPRITVINGDLQISGGISGGGLLIVTGNLSCSGPFIFSGLILVIGSGNLSLAGTGVVIEGGVFTANLVDSSGTILFGAPRVSISGNSRIYSNDNAVRTAISLIPPAQISFREIAGSDP